MKKQTIAEKINGMKKMRVSLATLMAVVMAIGLASFTTERNRNFLSIQLAFDTTVGSVLSETDVENELLWKEITPGFTCNAALKACTMYVSDAFLTGSSPRHLDPNDVTITASGNNSVGWVPQPQTKIDSIQNKP